MNSEVISRNRSLLFFLTSVCFVFLVQFLGVKVSSQNARLPCPSNAPTPIDITPYNFRYDSIQEKLRPGLIRVTRCIENQKNVDMYFRWDKIPLEGYLDKVGKPGGIAMHSISIPENQSIGYIDSPLWYGTSRKMTNAPFLTSKNSGVLSQKSEPLETEFVVSVPIDIKNPENGLITYKATFKSTVVSKYMTSFSYISKIDIINGSDNPNIKISLDFSQFINSGWVNKAEVFKFFKTSNNNSIALDSTNTFTSGKLSKFKLYRPEKANIIFSNNENQQLARATVALYVPEQQ